MNSYELAEKHEDKSYRFNNIKNPISTRKDLHAFMLLDKIFPGSNDIISCAEHDQIWLGITPEQILQLTEDQIIELTRCGIIFDKDFESLSMFV